MIDDDPLKPIGRLEPDQLFSVCVFAFGRMTWPSIGDYEDDFQTVKQYWSDCEATISKARDDFRRYVAKALVLTRIPGAGLMLDVEDSAYHPKQGHVGDRNEALSRVRQELQATRDSCLQAIDGSWEINDEGFQAMAASIERVAEELGISLDEYQPEDEEEQ